MAPLLDSEDEISEIEEVSETFIIVSAKNSPLIERKETTNMDTNGVTNFPKDINSYLNGTTIHDPDPPDKDLPGKNVGENSPNSVTADSGQNKEVSLTTPKRSSTTSSNSEEDQENIRPDKLKAKNKLNLKLNFNKKLEDKCDHGASNGHPATLNLPSPVTCLATSDKTSKVKRDSKMRVRVSKKKKKDSSDTKTNKVAKDGTGEGLVPQIRQNDSNVELVNGSNVASETISNSDSTVTKGETTLNEGKSDISELSNIDNTSDNKCVENVNDEARVSCKNGDDTKSHSSSFDVHGCDCLERKTPGIDEMIKKSTVLRKSSSEKKVGSSSRRRGSLPSPPLQPFLIKESIHRARKDSGSFEEEPITPPPVNNEDATPEDDFADEEEEEIVVLFKQNIGCDENEESEEEENSWSPSSLSDDENDDINDKSDSKTKPAPLPKLQPPELEEENGKTKVTEKFMKELISFYKTPINAAENGGYCGGNGGVSKLPSRTVIQILEKAKMHCIALPSLVDIEISNRERLNICGDVHGQFFDLLNIFENVTGFPSETNKYLFNGDFVDRGVWSVEVMIVLLGFKLLLPDCFFLVRGNHEAAEVNRVYGFENEVLAKYDAKMFQRFQRVFEWLPVSHCVNQSILVMHGGIPCSSGPYLAKQDKTLKSRKISFDCETHSLNQDKCVSDNNSSSGGYAANESQDEEENIPTLDDIRELRRGCQVPREGLMCDLLWADPQDENGVAPNSRGYSSVFGPDITKQFLSRNNLKYIVRSHECVQYGFDMCHDDTVITVFSAPNYCDRHGNKGAVCVVHGDDISMPEFRKFDAMPHPKVDRHKYSSIYMKFGLC